MNPLKVAEGLIKTRDEIREIRLRLEAKEKEIDRLADDLIEFLKHKRLIETRSV